MTYAIAGIGVRLQVQDPDAIGTYDDEDTRYNSGVVYDGTGSDDVYRDLTCDLLSLTCTRGGSPTQGSLLNIDVGTLSCEVYDPDRELDPLVGAYGVHRGRPIRLTSDVGVLWTGIVDEVTSDLIAQTASLTAVDAAGSLADYVASTPCPAQTAAERVQLAVTRMALPPPVDIIGTGVTMPAVALTGDSMAAVQAVVDADIGLWWVTPNGAVRYVAHESFPEAVSAMIPADFDSGWIADLSVSFGTGTVRVTSTDTSEQRATSQAVIDLGGTYVQTFAQQAPPLTSFRVVTPDLPTRGLYWQFDGTGWIAGWLDSSTHPLLFVPADATVGLRLGASADGGLDYWEINTDGVWRRVLQLPAPTAPPIRDVNVILTVQPVTPPGQAIFTSPMVQSHQPVTLVDCPGNPAGTGLYDTFIPTSDLDLLANVVTGDRIRGHDQPPAPVWVSNQASVSTYQKIAVLDAGSALQLATDTALASWAATMLRYRAIPAARPDEVTFRGWTGRADADAALALLVGLDVADPVHVHLTSRQPPGSWICRVASVAHTMSPDAWEITLGLARLLLDEQPAYVADIYDDAAAVCDTAHYGSEI